jgi:peptidoglycan/LPS O-acetylase OafA/YrhL
LGLKKYGALAYRPEIDGMRALAVLPVIAYHAGLRFFGGGYVGVDVFFVISGFLITSLILADDHFSFVRFYERRARRILPALFVVLVACIPFAVWLMLPYQLANFGKSVAAVSLFSSNIVFWRESGYFAAANELKPLLHTWSLAIEEQFYLVFPIALLGARRLGHRWLAVLVGASLVLSLGVAEWAARHSYAAINYYLIPSRAWELLVGVALALLARVYHERRGAEIFAALGVLLIGYAVIVYDATTPYPSLYTLAPTIGAALVIWFASPSTLIGRALAWRPLVAIGLVSYGAYLWHQPLLAFARLGHARPMGVALVLLATFPLAYLSYRYVERPARNPTIVSTRAVFRVAGSSMVAFVGIGGVLVLSRGLLLRFPAEDRELLSVNPAELGRYTERAFRSLVRPAFTPAGKRPRVAVIGDSYAQDFVNMAQVAGALDRAQFVAFPIAARCPKYLGAADVRALYAQQREFYDAAYCEGYSAMARARPLMDSADIIVLAAHWRLWEAQRIHETIREMHLRPSQSVLIVGSKYFGTIAPLGYRPLTVAQRRALRNPIDSLDVATNATFRVAGVPFVDTQRLLCGSDATCEVFGDGHLLTYDGEHFTPAGATYAAARVFAAPVLQHLASAP